MNNKLVIITGMHRSGTSALAKVFVDTGFDAGSNLIPPNKDNPAGYWEDFDIFNLNNQILSHLFLSWDKIENIESRRIYVFLDEVFAEYAPSALKIIREKLSKSSKVVIKDPRFAILMPFWNLVFRELNATVFHLHIFRHPLLVAKSLELRNGLSLNNGILLWYYYNMAFLSDFSGSSTFVSYDKLLQQHAETCLQIAKITGPQASEVDLSASIKTSLNHHDISENSIEQLDKILPEINKLWFFLNHLTNTPEIHNDRQEINQLIVPEITKYIVNDHHRKTTVNLVLDNQKAEKREHEIVAGKQLTDSCFLFAFNNRNQPIKKFLIYVDNKPCRIKNPMVSVKTEKESVSLKPESGNYLLCYNEEYYFNTNLPYFSFTLPDSHQIETVELHCDIHEIRGEDACLLISALNGKINSLEKRNYENQKSFLLVSTLNEKVYFLEKENLEMQNQNTVMTGQIQNLTSELEQVKLESEITERNNLLQVAKKDLEINRLIDLFDYEKQKHQENIKKQIDEIHRLKDHFSEEKHKFNEHIAKQTLEINKLKDHFEREKQKFHEHIEKQVDEINRLKDHFGEEKQKFHEQNAKQALEIEGLEKKSLWLYTEFNKAKNSISWRITAPLRLFQQLLNKIENRIFILKNDVGASYRLLKREGFAYFLIRLIWYLRGKRLKEEIEFAKQSRKESSLIFNDSIDVSEKLVFPGRGNPQVSIIITVFNNFGITHRCLRSILKNSGDANYEVIVVDDQSTETAFRLEEKFKGVHIIRNDQNLGYLKSCNKAALLAKGEFICFLNNDTEVRPDWLQHLVKLMESQEEIALAGPKLVYPDGRLQEAGGIVWDDASAWNFGKYDDAEKPNYNYLKQVDYVSGACMLIRKSVWEQLNGFDEQFSPAYYEDTDLAMRIRKLGFKVYYQPLSVVTHHEGVSNGFDETTGIKRFQTINRQKFLQKWEHQLKIECSPNGNNVFFHRDRSLHQKHLLVIDHYIPMFDQDAGSRSTFSYLKLFIKMGFKIHFIGDNYFRHEPYTTVLQQMGIEVLYGNYYQKNIRDWFRDNGQYISFVFAHRVHIAPKYFGMIKKFTTAKIGYVGHDLQYLGSKRKFELTGKHEFKKEIETFKQAETQIFNTVDYIFPFSTYEAPFIKEIAPDKVVTTIPVYFYENIPGNINGFDERRDILFIGYFGHPPNPDAILWFTKEVFPRLKILIPDVRLNIVGSQPTEEVKRLENDSITVTGYVSDEKLHEFYQTSKVAILPLRFGAGVKGKLLESLYHQIPTVITSVAAEGVPEIEKYSMIANDADEFADKIYELYTNKEVWNSYSENGKELIKKYYSEETAQRILESVFMG